MDLMEETGTREAPAPKTAWMAAGSTLSFKAVPVPWALM